MADLGHDDRRPSDAEIAAAMARANVIVWGSWWVCTFVLVAAFRVHDRWTGALLAGAIVGLGVLQHHAIKAARLLGHGKATTSAKGAKS